MRFQLEMLFQYCIIAACNIPFTKVFIVLKKIISEESISVDSGYYTLLSLFSAFLIYVLYAFKSHPDKRLWIRNCFLEAKERFKKKQIRGMVRDLAPAFLIMFAVCFMLFVFEPLLTYSTNMVDFWFDFKMMIFPVLKMFSTFLLVGFLIILAIYMCNLLFSEQLLVYKGTVLAGFAGFLLLYIQGNWLTGNLPELTGEEIVWRDHGGIENLVFLFALIFLTIVIIDRINKTNLDRVIRYAAMVSSAVFVMLIVSLIPTMATKGAFENKDSFIATTENFNTISTNKNFLIFLVDAVDSTAFDEVYNSDEDFQNLLDDFTYYPDTLGVFQYTQDSIPAILTGVLNHNETGFMRYSSNAYNQSALFRKLEQNGYNLNLYSTAVSWGGQREFPIENAASIYDAKIDFTQFVKQEMRYILFKYLPYPLKRYSKIETLNFDSCKIIDSQKAYEWRNNAVYKSIQSNLKLKTQDGNYFQFIHCSGGHKPYDLDKDLNHISGGSYNQQTASALTLIRAYLQRLKDNDAYDNSAIVILADHGYWTTGYASGSQPYRSLQRCNPLLLIKGINEKHPFTESDLPISYLDLQDAFSDLIDGKKSDELFPDVEPGRTRTFIWQQNSRKKYHMVEYATNGKANEFENFYPTGIVYDLKG